MSDKFVFDCDIGSDSESELVDGGDGGGDAVDAVFFFNHLQLTTLQKWDWSGVMGYDRRIGEGEGR